MRRFLVGLLAILVCGCGWVEYVNRKVVARVGDHVLATDWFAETVANTNIPIRPELIERWAWLWIQYSLYSQRLAMGDSLNDSATIYEAMWPNILTNRVARLHDHLVAERLDLGPAVIDSAYAAGDYRVIDHILMSAGAGSTETEREAQRGRADAIRGRLVAGAAWDDEVQVSEDPGSVRRGGRLGIVARGQALPEFEQAAFELEPGELSEVTETYYGFHVIRRPTLDEVREEFTDSISDVLIQRFMDDYRANLSGQYQVRVREGAPDLVREVASRPLRVLALEPGDIIADFEGGTLTDVDFVRWLQVLPGIEHLEMLDAPDEQLMEMIHRTINNELLKIEVDLQGIELLPEEFEDYRRLSVRDQERLRRAMGIDSVLARAEGLEERMRIARETVDRYVSRIMRTQRNIEIVPPMLAAYLRSDAHWRLYYGGLNRAIERAVELRAARDSTTQ